MFGEKPASAMEDILAAASSVVNDEADDISAFIDLSVLIRHFLCKQLWMHGGGRVPRKMSRPAVVTVSNYRCGKSHFTSEKEKTKPLMTFSML